MTTPDDRAAWLEQRKKYVTASDISALLGENKHRTREDLLAEKRGLVDGFDGNEYTEIALAFEGPVMTLAARRYGWSIRHNGLTLVIDDECPRHASTPDGLMDSPYGLAVVQVKWTTCKPQEECEPFTKKGAPSTATYLHGPPLGYQLQVQSEMACTGAIAGVLLVMHTAAPSGLKLRPYYVARHEGVIAKIRREVARFWEELGGT